MPAACSALTTSLNSRTCSPPAARRGILVVRREVADRVVAPVVAQPAIEQQRVLHELVDGQQLDGGDAELLQVLDRRRDAPGRRRCRASSSGSAGVRFVNPLTCVS